MRSPGSAHAPGDLAEVEGARHPDIRALLGGAHSLIASTLVTGALGVAFWILAARLFSSVTVGRDAALIAVMVELSVLCQLDMESAILRFVPDLGPAPGRVGILGAYAISGSLAVGVGTAFVLLAPSLSASLSYLHDDPALAVAFVATLVLWGWFVLQDAALTALRHARWVPIENGAFGALKLAALPALLATGTSHAVFLAWALPVLPLILGVNAMLIRVAIPAHHESRPMATPSASSLARLGRRRAGAFLARDYVAGVFGQASLSLLPLLVISLFGPSQSAYFGIALSISLAFDTLASGAANALVVEATLQQGRFASLLGAFARRIALPLGALALALALAAPLLLAVFGGVYEEHATSTLRLLLAASALRVPLASFNAICKSTGRPGQLLAAQLVVLLGVLAVCASIPHSWGIDGVACAWLLANAAACVYALARLPRLVRAPEAVSGRSL